MSDDQELAKPEEAADGHVAIQMHEKSLARIIDMLRNEKPIYGNIDTDLPGDAFISTLHEPVGEEEKSGGFFRR